MKKGEQPDLSAKWWKDSQPKGLKAAGKLDDALKDYDGAKRKFEQSGDAAAGAAANGALDAVEAAAKAAGAEAGKAKGAPEMEWTADALKKMDRLIAAERKWIGENTEADDDSDFGSPEAYGAYLLKSLKRLRSAGQMNFGVVLGKKPEESRLAIHKAKGGKALGGVLMRETGLHVMTFGIAMTPKGAGDMEAEQSEGETQEGEGLGDEKSSTLILALEGRQLPGLKKKLTKTLKKFRVPFKRVQLMVEGKEVEDIVDPEDTETDEDEGDEAPRIDAAALERELALLVRQVVVLTDPARKATLGQMAARTTALLRGGALEETQAGIAELRAALASPIGANGGNGAANGGAERAAVYAKSGQAWIAARGKVAAEIEKLRAALVAAYQGDGLAGEIESRFRARVVPVLAALGADLPAKLAAASGATDPTARAARLKEAQDILQSCHAFIDGEPLLAELDTNPFVPLAIRQTMSATVAALEKAVH